MPDINGTRHHLLLGRDDWQRCTSPGAEPGWYYDPADVVTLAPIVFQFPQPPGDPVLTIADRRGASADAYGHWYWIDREGTGIRVRWAGAHAGDKYWSSTDAPASEPPADGSFTAASSKAPAPELLAGLAVTTGHYLVAGSPKTGTLLVFDLHTGGAPSRVPLPPLPGASAGTHAEPFDLAPTADGGLLVLDRAHKVAWQLDTTFRPAPPAAPEPAEPMLFQPQTGPARAIVPAGTPAALPLVGAADPVSIAPLPDDTFLILDRDGPNFATVRHYDGSGGAALGSVPLLEASLRAADEPVLNLPRIQGHDMAFVPAGAGPGGLDTLFVADAGGNQAFALTVSAEAGLTLRAQRQYYPLRSYTGKALVAPPGESRVYFDQDERWMPVVALGRPRYATRAVLDLPVLDGKEPGCVWHRLCLDACIPPTAAVRISTRAADEEDQLAWQPWSDEPAPYRRGDGAELPYYSLWSPAELQVSGTGTWETLFQNARGRYLAIRLELSGDGRTTPKIRALRAHYPRFSYLSHYLPAVYRDDVMSASFLERFLANPEGLLTTLEGLVADAQVFWDTRTAPSEALDWLASWIGLVLDPTWSDYQRRLLISHAPDFYARRGTVTGLMQAIRLALEPEAGPVIFEGEYDDYPGAATAVRIVERFRTRRLPGVALGDPTETAGPAASADPLAVARERAHRFTVLLPSQVCVDGSPRPSSDIAAQVERLVAAEKPAHTWFAVKRYWAMFRVGEVRVGLDTRLGEGGRFETIRLGETALAEGALAAMYPFNLSDRTVVS